jgi:hypothetical protein
MSDYRNKIGKVFSEEQLRKSAAEGNLSFEEYLIIGGFELYIEKGKQAGTTKKAVVGVPLNLTAGTGSLLDDISLDSPDPNKKETKEDDSFWDKAEFAEIDIKKPETLVDKDEDTVLDYLSVKFQGINFRTTGLGDAIEYEVDGEVVEIDLQPFLNKNKAKAAEQFAELDRYYKSLDTRTRRAGIASNISKWTTNDFDDEAVAEIKKIGYDIQEVFRGRGNSTFVLKKDGKRIGEEKSVIKIQDLLKNNLTDEDIDILQKNTIASFEDVKQLISEEQNKVIVSEKEAYSALSDWHLSDEKNGYSKYIISSLNNVLNEEETETVTKYFEDLKEKVLVNKASRKWNGQVANLSDEEIVSMMHDISGLPADIQQKIKANFNAPYNAYVKEIEKNTLEAKKIGISNSIVAKNQKTIQTTVNFQKINFEEKSKIIQDQSKSLNLVSEKLLSSIDSKVKSIVNKYPGANVGFEISEKGIITQYGIKEKGSDLSTKDFNSLAKEIKSYVETRNSIVKDYNDSTKQLEDENNKMFLDNYISDDILNQAFKNNNRLDILSKDFHDASAQLLLAIPTLFNAEWAIKEQKALNTKNLAFPEMGSYDDEFTDKSLFALRTLFQQGPNIILAVGTSGVGNYINATQKAASAIIAAEFGLSSGAQKYRDLSIGKEIAVGAKAELAELEANKEFMSVDDYNVKVADLHAQISYGDLTDTQIISSSLATGIIEGGFTYVIGTAPNAVKIAKQFKNTPAAKITEIAKMNTAQRIVHQTGNVLKPITGEVLEEEAIYVGSTVSDFLILNREINLDQIDDVGITSVIMAGPMNGPSALYSNIISAANAKKYKETFDKVKKDIDRISLQIAESKDEQVKSILSNRLSEKTKQLAIIGNEIEIDALGLGGEGMRKIVDLNFVLNNLYLEAGVKPNEAKDIVEQKIKTYAGTLGETQGKQFL